MIIFVKGCHMTQTLKKKKKTKDLFSFFYFPLSVTYSLSLCAYVSMSHVCRGLWSIEMVMEPLELE